MTDKELLKKALHRIEYHYEGDPDDKEAAEAIKARLAQPEKEWVGMTDEEVQEAGKLNIEGERMLPYSFAKAIEAKLKEKNT